MSINSPDNQEELIALNRQLRDVLRRDRRSLLKLVRRVASNTSADARRLIRAVTSRGVNDVRSELSRGADPNARSADGEPAILIAASRGRIGHPIVAALLQAGADVDAADPDGNTALIANCRDADLPLVRLLTEAGADVNRPNHHGDTPLTNAATWGAASVVKHLLSCGADPHLPDGAGVLAADLAASQGHSAIASRLRLV